MDNKKYNIFISAIIAISIYIFLILLFILYIKSSNVKKFESISKNTILELDLIIDKKINKTKTINKTPKISSIKIKSKKIIKKSTAISAKKKTNLKSLFARVSTKAIAIKNKNVLNIRSNKISSRFKSKYQREKSRKRLSNLKLLDIDKKINYKKTNIQNNKGNYDAYYSKISNIILSRWYNYPLFKQKDYLLIAEITINSKGIFSYYITTYSGNIIVDQEVTKFLNNEILHSYPIAPDGKTKKIRINFKPEKDK